MQEWGRMNAGDTLESLKRKSDAPCFRRGANCANQRARQIGKS